MILLHKNPFSERCDYKLGQRRIDEASFDIEKWLNLNKSLIFTHDGQDYHSTEQHQWRNSADDRSYNSPYIISSDG